MIAPEDDDGVFSETGRVESIEDAADLRVHEGGTGEIGADEVSPLVVVLEPLQAGFGQFPMEIPGKAGRVRPVNSEEGRQHGVVVGEQIEPFLSGIAGDMRQEEAGGKEERLIIGCGLELFDGPACDLVIAFVFIAMREHAPVHERMISHRGGGNELLFGSCANAAGGAPNIKLRGPRVRAAGTAMVDLAGAQSPIAVRVEMLRQSDAVSPRVDVAEPRGESIDAGGGGAQAEHETGAGGIAQRRLHVGVQERGAARREPVDVWRAGQWMAAEVADPVVLIIDGDEEHIGFWCGETRSRRQSGENQAEP